MTDTAFHKDDNTLPNLEALGGDQNASSPAQGQPPEGALGAPAPAGGTQAPPSDINGQLGAGQTYFDLWNEASDEDKNENTEEMETQLGAHGTGIIAKTNEIASNAMAQKDGKTLNLLLKWGWRPNEERPAFDPASMGEADPSGKVEGALGAEAGLPIVGPETEQPEVAAFSGGEPEEAMGPPEERGGLSDEDAHAKKMFNRRKMGGFLMELGLNILASNRDDAGAAVGDAFGKTRADRDARKRTAAADSLAESERGRRQGREDEADKHKRAKEKRDEKKAEREAADAKRKQDEFEGKGFIKVDLPDGGIAYGKINPETGRVEDPQGNELKGTSDADRETLNSEATTNRLHVGLRREITNTLNDLIQSIRTGDEEQFPEVWAIKNAKGAERKRLIAAYKKQAFDDATGKVSGTLDPIGLLNKE